MVAIDDACEAVCLILNGHWQWEQICMEIDSMKAENVELNEVWSVLSTWKRSHITHIWTIEAFTIETLLFLIKLLYFYSFIFLAFCDAAIAKMS